ncbi:MAG: hypothetical protein VW683_00075 [Betaproteobacteria bacterium]|jgi:hypothetical protein
MKDRFHLEQEIIDCWGITDDIQTIIDNCEDLTEDQLMNSLIGIKELYNLKFRTMFSTFEGLIPTMKIGKDVQEAIV